MRVEWIYVLATWRISARTTRAGGARRCGRIWVTHLWWPHLWWPHWWPHHWWPRACGFYVRGDVESGASGHAADASMQRSEAHRDAMRAGDADVWLWVTHLWWPRPWWSHPLWPHCARPGVRASRYKWRTALSGRTRDEQCRSRCRAARGRLLCLGCALHV